MMSCLKKYVLLVLGLPLYSYGQILPVALIPDSLTQNANAVYILNEGHFEIFSANRSKFAVHQTIAILNQKGQWFAAKTLGYDKEIQINSFKGSVYDSFGNLIKKLKKSDIRDQSSYDGFSVYSDNRLMHADLRQIRYPYIVEFEYEFEYKNTFQMPDWMVLPAQNVSVLKSAFTIKSPKKHQPRVKIENTTETFTVSQENDAVLMEISFSNLTVKNREWYGPSFDEIRPIIRCAPSAFVYDGYEGDMSTWDGFGKWLQSLNSDRDKLDDETVTEVINLTKNLESREEKIKAIYHFAQNKTRYVSIQLGIGGYQPFPASTVDKLGYGDCKALSNYTYALLKAIGISSNYTLISAGENPSKIDLNFPNNTFNHAILGVPNGQDTVWLECTSQTKSFGFMGKFTGDRDVLMLNENGAEVVHTTIYSKEDNTQISKMEVALDDTGQASARIDVIYSGIQTENYNLNSLITKTKKEQEEWIYEHTDIGDFTLQAFNFEIEKKKIPDIKEHLTIDIRDLATVKGSRLFFAPNLLNKWDSNPKKYSDRETDIIRKFAGTDIDTVIYSLPKKFRVEFLPEPILISTVFGKYSSSVNFSDGKLVYVRNLVLNQGRFPKESYDEFRNFYRDISKADKMKVVFVDKT